MNEITNTKLSEIASLAIENVEPISIELFSKRTTRTVQLVNNADPTKHLSGQNREYSFELEDAVFATNIDVYTSAYGSFDEAHFKYESSTAIREFEKAVRNSSDKFSIEVNDFISSFSFKPGKKYFGSPVISKVIVTGYTKAEFIEAASKLEDIEDTREEIHAECKKIMAQAAQYTETINLFGQKKKSVEDAIAQISHKKEEIEESILSLTAAQDGIKSAIISLKSEESDILTRLEHLEDAVDKKKKETQSLNTELVDNESKLKKLQDDVNMFPSEISGFVQQGGKNIFRYTFLAAIPILILAFVTYRLFSNAVDLTQVYKHEKDLDIWAIFLTRIPYVLVSMMIIHACYKIAKVFIAEIMRINQQRLNLSKMSIIAKDVSDASFDSAEHEVGAKYALRTKLKMTLLKEHLKGYLPADYEYEDNETSSIFLKFLKKKDSSDFPAGH
jgi:hypothetical protein